MRKSSVFEMAKNLIFPTRCVFCRKLLRPQSGQKVCPDCMNTIPFVLSYHRCSRCGRPVSEAEKLCYHCMAEQTPYYSGISAPYLYKDSVRLAVLRFKHERFCGYASLFAEHIQAILRHDGVDLSFDWIVSAPPRRVRIKKSNYDQAACLGRALAKSLQIPYLPKALSQIEKREKQSSLPRGERFYNIVGNIRVEKAGKICGKRVLLVDDVCTTGATLKEVAKMLVKAGAAEVYCAVAAVVE